MSLLDALAAATDDDLKEISDKLASLESEVENLKEVKRLLEVRLGHRKPQGHHLRGRGRRAKVQESEPSQGESVAAPTAASAVASSSGPMTQTELHRVNVRKYLMANGPQVQGRIVAQTEVPSGSITNVMKHKWFVQRNGSWHLTPHGVAGTP